MFFRPVRALILDPSTIASFFILSRGKLNDSNMNTGNVKFIQAFLDLVHCIVPRSEAIRVKEHSGGRIYFDALRFSSNYQVLLPYAAWRVILFSMLYDFKS